MMKKIISLSLISILTIVSCKKGEKKEVEPVKEDVTKYVDPFIGTGGHGHTFPGATTPFGMIQLSPINGISGWDWCSGYHYSDSLVIGFGHLSLSGTGIGDLNDIVLMPATKESDLSTLTIGKKDQYFKDADKFRDLVPYKSKYSHKNEKASVGYYQVYLETPKINAEFTADTYVGMHKYTFEKGDTQSIILNLGFAINWDNPTQMNIRQYISDKDTSIHKNMIFGHRYSVGWAKNQKVFFAIEFSKDINNIKYNKDKDNNNKKNINWDNNINKNENIKGIKKRGIYIHIPFCKQKCGYCDFHSFAKIEDLKGEYVEALCNEIKEFSKHIPDEDKYIDTIFFRRSEHQVC